MELEDCRHGSLALQPSFPKLVVFCTLEAVQCLYTVQRKQYHYQNIFRTYRWNIMIGSVNTVTMAQPCSSSHFPFSTIRPFSLASSTFSRGAGRRVSQWSPYYYSSVPPTPVSSARRGWFPGFLTVGYGRFCERVRGSTTTQKIDVPPADPSQ